jgi:hypothetical protein
MGQPVVLPKFELPGDRPHWAVRTAWIAGGFLLVSIVGLGFVIVHHRNLETQAHIARAEAIAKVRAEAEAKVAIAAASAKAERDAVLAAKLAARTVPATTVAAAGASAESPNPGKPAKSNHGHRGHSMRGAKGSKTAGKTAPKSESGKSASNKPDAIDELLRKMK